MEKEMKKLVLVAVSVGVFLVVIVGVAILFLSPKPESTETAFSSSYPVSAGRVQPGLTNSESPVITNTQETNFYINNDKLDTETSIEVDKIDKDRVTIKIPKPTTAAVPETSAPAAQAAPSKPATSKSAAPAKSAPSSKAAPKAAPQKAAKPAPAKKINDYWVQAGAFEAKVRAEDVQEKLASKGITTIIENRLVEGKTMYRVRMGPYTSEKEADYWLALVKSIDGFSGSQVRQTAR